VGEIESVERAGAEVSLGEGRDEAASCIGAYLRPQPPVSFGIQVAHDGLATAMLDVSDGLGIDLMRLCRASGVGVDLDLAEVEDRAELRRWEAEGMGSVRDWVLGGGDDYELLGATPPDKADEIHAAAAELGVTLRFLGRFSSASERCRIRAEDGYEPLGIRGWDHFRSSVGSA
jgi:thiamine-monophosphate kinase